MSRSILSIAHSSASRIVPDPSRPECVIRVLIISFKRSVFSGSCCNQHSAHMVLWRMAVNLPIVRRPSNCPHKLTKTAEPWRGGGAALGGSELHARGTSAAVRSRHCMLVAAAAAPPVGGRHGGGFCSLE